VPWLIPAPIGARETLSHNDNRFGDDAQGLDQPGNLTPWRAVVRELATATG
jgi:hypothetical protein